MYKLCFSILFIYFNHQISKIFIVIFPGSGALHKKVKEPGVALCTLCNSSMKYSSSGKKALLDHMKSDKHMKLQRIQKTNYSVSGNYRYFVLTGQPILVDHIFMQWVFNAPVVSPSIAFVLLVSLK